MINEPKLSSRSTEEDSINPKPSPTLARGNFKTFTLLRQQEDLISRFESNLQKTLELIRDQPNSQNSFEEYSIKEDFPTTFSTDKIDLRESLDSKLKENFGLTPYERSTIKQSDQRLRHNSVVDTENLDGNTKSLEQTDLARSRGLELSKKDLEFPFENHTLKSELGLNLKTSPKHLGESVNSHGSIAPPDKGLVCPTVLVK